MFESRMTGTDLMIRIYLFLKKLKKLAGIIEINSWHFMLSVIYSGINSCQSYILAFWTLAEAFRQYCVSNSDIMWFYRKLSMPNVCHVKNRDFCIYRCWSLFDLAIGDPSLRDLWVGESGLLWHAHSCILLWHAHSCVFFPLETTQLAY